MEWIYDDLIEWITNGCDKEIAKNIIELDVQSAALTSLPSEIGNLINLRELDCSGNELTSLPSEIGNLINLR